jgi:HEAT repeat protein
MAVKSQEAAMILTNLGKSRHAAVRRTAIEMLRALTCERVADELRAKLEPIFRSALDDDDPLVQYHALVGLAQMRYGKDLWGGTRTSSAEPVKRVPSYELFLEDQHRYTEEWKKEDSSPSSAVPPKSP